MVVHVVRSELSQKDGAVNYSPEMQEDAAATESFCAVNKFSHSQHNSGCVSESYKSLSGHHIVTDRKPPLMKKAKTPLRSIRSLFEEASGARSSSSSFIFPQKTPEVPRSAETVRRKLHLPWRKKKKHSYMPDEETNRWRSNFENWRSASQLSLETNSESDSTAGDRGLCRMAFSHTDLHVDSVDSESASGWTDSDTDTVSEDPLGGSLNEHGMFVLVKVLL